MECDKCGHDTTEIGDDVVACRDGKTMLCTFCTDEAQLAEIAQLKARVAELEDKMDRIKLGLGIWRLSTDTGGLDTFLKAIEDAMGFGVIRVGEEAAAQDLPIDEG